MAIAMFRTCIEVSLKDLFLEEYHFTYDDSFAYVFDTLNADGKLDNMTEVIEIVKKKGNKAIHQAEVFTPKDISKTIVYFDSIMEYLNSKFEKKCKASKKTCI